ncbi:MAG: C39 family peptidase, partial [Methanophagales archaeon]|nr:C39 family peptidase [Methanophagales archaeon]
NYWDDYTDTNANGDGIWDHPYSIDGDKDNYPLVDRFEDYQIGGTPSNILQVPYEAQGSSKWCVLASTAMVLKYYGFNTHAWDIAAALNQPQNEGFSTLDPVFSYISVFSALSVHRGLDNPLIDDGDYIRWEPGHPTFLLREYLVRELTKDKNPVILETPFVGADHVVVVTGVTNSDVADPTFYLNDPSGSLFDELGLPENPHINRAIRWKQLEPLYSGDKAYCTLSIEGKPKISIGSFSELFISIYANYPFGRYASTCYDRGLQWEFADWKTNTDDYSATFNFTDTIVISPTIANHMNTLQEYHYIITDESARTIGEPIIPFPVGKSEEIGLNEVYQFSDKGLSGRVGIYMELYDLNNNLLDRIGPITFNITPTDPDLIIEDISWSPSNPKEGDD